MSVLTLQLAGPLQSWGLSSRFAWRTTAPAPTKSGIVGLLASALGVDRTKDEELNELAKLRLGVRVDQPGTRVRDFQTAHHSVTGRSMPLSERFYLADAVFVAVVEGDDELIHRLHDAVRQPHYLPYLGRRSCPPAQPIDLGVSATDMVTALSTEEWRASAWYRRRTREAFVDLDVFLEAEPAERAAEVQRDQPVSFDPHHRQYALRAVRADTVRIANPAARRPAGISRPAAVPDHDPTTLLEGI